MTNLGTILQHLYPNANALRDYRVQDDGSGPYIAHWNSELLGPQPDQAALEAAEQKALDAIAAKRKIADIEAATGFTRKQREFIVANGDGALKAALAVKESEIAAEREKLK